MGKCSRRLLRIGCPLPASAARRCSQPSVTAIGVVRSLTAVRLGDCSWPKLALRPLPSVRVRKFFTLRTVLRTPKAAFEPADTQPICRSRCQLGPLGEVLGTTVLKHDLPLPVMPMDIWRSRDVTTEILVLPRQEVPPHPSPGVGLAAT
jgi:hypothetical protein